MHRLTFTVTDNFGAVLNIRNALALGPSIARMQRRAVYNASGPAEGLPRYTTSSSSANTSTSPSPPHVQAIRKPRNDEITFHFVQLVDPRTGGVRQARPLQRILGALNLKRFSVELVSEQPRVLVRIIDRHEEFEKSRAKKNTTATTVDDVKEVQFTWDIAPNDLARKICKAREILEKGAGLNVAISVKKGRAPPTRWEMQDAVGKIVDDLADISTENRRLRVMGRVSTLLNFSSTVSESPVEPSTQAHLAKTQHPRKLSSYAKKVMGDVNEDPFEKLMQLYN